MKITPIASDSMGTRSTCTLVETKSCKILLDPSAALGPYRFGKSPHALEWERLNEHWAAIKKTAAMSDILVVNHYHYDHYNPDHPELYKDKTVFLKHSTQNINKSQTQRSAFFLKQVEGIPKKVLFSDGSEHEFGKTRIKFSNAAFHGTNNKLGYVTMVSISQGDEKFVYTSDVEGPAIDHQAQFILDEKPTVIYIDGPMTYMLGYRYSQQSLDASIANIKKFMDTFKPESIIIEHHLLRDIKWKQRIASLEEHAAKLKVNFTTAAGFVGKEVDQLEANRTTLWKKHPSMQMPQSELKAED